jgi:ATP-dependent DNA helicase PIF1
VAILLLSDDSAGLAIPGLPNGMILIKTKTVAVPAHMRGKDARSRGKPGFRWITQRTGPLCTPAFAITDQKSQGKQFSDVLVNLKGVCGGGTATRPSFMSLYVQLSRAQSWDGLHLFREPARSDFIEPKNVLDKDMRDAILKLERRDEDTRRRFEREHSHKTWFQEWNAMAEAAQATEAIEEED